MTLDAILGLRIGSIPVEDAAFAFVMFVLPVAIYEALSAERPVPSPARRAGPVP